MIRALILALAALALLPPAASAHAVLEATTPEGGARLKTAPEQIVLRFSEPVEAEFGAVRVFDSHGREVQAGGTISRGAEVAVRLRGRLGVALHQVGLARAAALECALPEQVLHERAHVQADLSP